MNERLRKNLALSCGHLWFYLSVKPREGDLLYCQTCKDYSSAGTKLGPTPMCRDCEYVGRPQRTVIMAIAAARQHTKNSRRGHVVDVLDGDNKIEVTRKVSEITTCGEPTF